MIETGYDAQDNVTRVDFDGRLVASFGRDALGREIERRAGALTTLSDYDPQGRLSRQTGRTATSQTLIERRYQWNTSDHRVETLDIANGLSGASRRVSRTALPEPAKMPILA